MSFKLNFKELLVPFAIALAITFGFRYIYQFFFDKNSVNIVTNNRTFSAPTSKQTAEPLDLDIDFYDSEPVREKKITSVVTSYGQLDFSNNGAVLERLSYNNLIKDRDMVIETIKPSFNKEDGTFLVALNGIGKTPFYYNFIKTEQIKSEDKFGDKSQVATSVVYEGESPAAKITKQFIVYKNIYKIDLVLTVEPKNNNKIRPRVLFSAPNIIDKEENFINNAIFLNESNSIEKIAVTSKSLASFGKVNPTLFGLESHYFVNSLVNDKNGFAKRAYYKLQTGDSQTILQSSFVKSKSSWKMSFYFGPKEPEAIVKVDKKLEKVIDYGWFWFIAKPLFYLLDFLYNIFKNYGLAIIILTILLSILLLPFTLKGEKSQRKSLEIQRRMRHVEQKYKNDPEMLMRQKGEIAKEQLSGTLGCLLPLLVKLPIFLGLRTVLANSIDLYKAPFLWIPDLSAKDPYYILPIIVGIGMALQALQNTNDPKQRFSNVLMAIIAAGLFSNFSAGLSLYFAMSTVLAVAQTSIQRWWKRS